MCAFGKFKSHRASVDYLWQHWLLCVWVCVWINAYVYAYTSPGHPSFHTISSAVDSSVGLFPVINFHLTHPAVHGKDFVARVELGFCLFLSDVAAGLDWNAAGGESLPVPLGILSTEKWHHADSSAYNCHGLNLKVCSLWSHIKTALPDLPVNGPSFALQPIRVVPLQVSNTNKWLCFCLKCWIRHW